MTNWTKYTPVTGRKEREVFAISKNARGNTYLVVPLDIAPIAAKADYYTSGDLLALKFCDEGKYTVCSSSRLSIPRQMGPKVPQGTQDVEHTMDGDMYVFDLSKLGGNK